MDKIVIIIVCVFPFFCLVSFNFSPSCVILVKKPTDKGLQVQEKPTCLDNILVLPRGSQTGRKSSVQTMVGNQCNGIKEGSILRVCFTHVRTGQLSQLLHMDETIFPHIHMGRAKVDFFIKLLRKRQPNTGRQGGNWKEQQQRSCGLKIWSRMT